MIKPIYIIGMPATGKSKLGKALAKELKLPFIDLDDLVTTKTGKSIREIFLQDGEAFFRAQESEALEEFIASKCNAVVATGGGTPCFFDHMHKMNASGLTVHLSLQEEKLLNRLLKPTKKVRPMWSGLNITEAKKLLETLYLRRISTYEQAQIHVRLVDNYKLDLHSLLKVVKFIYY